MQISVNSDIIILEIVILEMMHSIYLDYDVILK